MIKNKQKTIEEKKRKHIEWIKTQTGVHKKLNTEQIVNIYKEIGSFRAIDRKYGVSHDTISKINKQRFCNITDSL